MKKIFLAWVKGIFEDEYLPKEIKYIYFLLHEPHTSIYLSLGGTEFEQTKIINLDFYPLDAQFFNIYSYDKNFTLLSLRHLLESCLYDKDFFNIFKDKKICYGIYGDDKIYTL